jgi:hypothetical protein
MRRYRLGRNKQKEFCELVQELRIIEDSNADLIWQKSGALGIDLERSIPPQDRFGRIRKVLRERRYPRLSQYEERYRELRSSLGLPQQVQLKVPPYFEGSQVSLAVRARSAMELRGLLDETRGLLKREELDQIFELL